MNYTLFFYNSLLKFLIIYQGSESVHKYVGREPSGRSFNEICLDHNNQPHNPMINSGAIVTSSLIKPDINMADRFVDKKQF